VVQDSGVGDAHPLCDLGQGTVGVPALTEDGHRRLKDLRAA
jgi:hypothetical protein